MLKANRTQLEQLLKALDAHAIVSITDNQGNITFFNDKFVQISQYSQAELMGKNHRLLKSGLHPASFYAEMWDAISSGKIWHGEICNRKKDGSYYWVNSTIYPLLDDNQLPTAYISIRTDITDRMEFSEALQNSNVQLQLARELAESANLAKSTFLSNMSHEIRTPLNCVIGLAQLALVDAPASKQTDYFKHILTSGNHLLGVINNILDISRIEAGKLTIESRHFNFSEVIEIITSMLLHHARKKNLELIFEVAENIPQSLHGDPMRLAQILINYIGNAIKFTAQGKISVRVSMRDQSPHLFLLYCEVQDSGSGISAEDQPRLFQTFNQLDNSNTREHGGSGLGLSICKNLAKLMHGEVGVVSQPGHGSTFWFTALLGKGTAPYQSKDLVPAPHAVNLSTLDGANILLAEDNVFNQEFFTECLNKQGAIVTLAKNGQEVLDALQRHRIDCILMDMQMPVMSGIEATRHIRAIPELAQLPIIAITASSSTEDQKNCLYAGMNDFVSKPVNLDKLYATLCKWLQQSTDPMLTNTSQIEDHASMGQHVFDINILSGLLENDPLSVRKHAFRFLQVTENSIAEMETALEAKDLPALSALCHRTYSSASMVGAFEFADLCQTLEFLKPDSDPAYAKTILARLKTSFSKVKIEIERQIP